MDIAAQMQVVRETMAVVAHLLVPILVQMESVVVR
jgi:hypothetical protein